MIDDTQATYDAAAQAIKAVEAMEQAAADEPTVTVSMPIKAAIEALCAIAVKLQIEEGHLEDRLRGQGLPGMYARAEIAKLRIAIDAFREGIKAIDSTAKTTGEQ